MSSTSHKSRSLLTRSSSVSKEPTLQNVVEESGEHSVFHPTAQVNTEGEPLPFVDNSKEEVWSSATMEPYNRRDFSKKKVMQTKIRYHFMNPWEKYKARNRKPWKLVIQILKIIIVTIQVYLFGSDRFSVVTFLDDNRQALQFLFLKDYSGEAPGNITVYTKHDVYSYLHYAHEQYYNIDDTVGNYDYPSSQADGSPPPVQLCYKYYKELYINASSNSFRFDPEVISVCEFLPNPVGNNHLITNASFSFGRLLSIKLNFYLKAINLKGVKVWDKPACYELNITILFDNTKRDGQMPIHLNVQNKWLSCQPDSEIHTPDFENSQIIRIALMAFDVVVILICTVSLVLSVRSIYKSFRLARETRRYFRDELHDPLTPSDARELFNLWFVVIIVSDCLTILGSTYKVAIDQKDANYYDVCSILLGIAVLLVWCGLLRFLGYFKQYNTLLVTMQASAPSVMRFCLCAGVLFLGFTFCGWIVIGPHNPKFRDTTITAECLYSLVNGDDMYNTYTLVNPKNKAVWIYSKLYLYVFIALFIYVVLSLFISIIGDTYERLKDLGPLPVTRLRRFIEESSRGMISPDTSQPILIGDSHQRSRTPSAETNDSIIRRVSLDSTGAE